MVLHDFLHGFRVGVPRGTVFVSRDASRLQGMLGGGMLAAMLCGDAVRRCRAAMLCDEACESCFVVNLHVAAVTGEGTAAAPCAPRDSCRLMQDSCRTHVGLM